MRRTAIAVVTAAAVHVVAPVAAAQMPPMPAPGPEQAIFKMDEGVWDAAIELNQGPDAAATTSAGIETNIVGCGGLCLITDFKGDLVPGMTLHGHGLTAWDSAAKKYVGTWTDSMSDGLATMSGTYDAASRTMTTTMEGRDTSGALVKSRTVAEHLSPDKRVMTMYTTGANGEEVQIMRVTYVRRK
jgi:hypothetical protein